MTAVIVPKENMRVSLEDVRGFCRDKIAGYKIPKEIILVDEIPRNMTGKVKKVELKEEILERKSSLINALYRIIHDVGFRLWRGSKRIGGAISGLFLIPQWVVNSPKLASPFDWFFPVDTPYLAAG